MLVTFLFLYNALHKIQKLIDMYKDEDRPLKIHLMFGGVLAISMLTPTPFSRTASFKGFGGRKAIHPSSAACREYTYVKAVRKVPSRVLGELEALMAGLSPDSSTYVHVYTFTPHDG